MTVNSSPNRGAEVDLPEREGASSGAPQASGTEIGSSCSRELLAKGLALGLFALFLTLSLTSSLGSSPTLDEVYHVASGYSLLETGDDRFANDIPPLMRVLSALPLLLVDLDPVETTPGWRESDHSDFELRFYCCNRLSLRRILRLARGPALAVGLVLGLVLLLWARQLWGRRGGLLVLFLFACSPGLIANSGLVGTDVAISLFTTLTAFLIWRLGRYEKRLSALWAGMALGLALLTKYSGIITAALALAWLLLLAFEKRSRQREPWRPLLRELAIRVAIVFSAAGIAVEIGMGGIGGWARYLSGLGFFLEKFQPESWMKSSFLWGVHSQDGFWNYYLLAQTWKTPLPILIFAAAATVLLLRSSGRRFEAIFLWLPIVAFHVAGLFSSVNVGVRHVLPTLPFLLLLSGALARTLARDPILPRILSLALLGWLLLGTLRTHPDHLSYFNELVGGTENGIRYLDDSNIDWGQDLYRLAEWIEKQPPQRIRMTVFGILPDLDYGFQLEPLSLRDLVWPQPGTTYVVSADFLQRVSLAFDNPALRFEWLDRYEPVERIGGSLYVYRFSIDPRDRDSSEVFYVDEDRWRSEAVSSLSAILEHSPEFTEARELRSEAAEGRTAP